MVIPVIQSPSIDFYRRLLSCNRYEDIEDMVLRPVAEAIGAPGAVFLQFVSSSWGEDIVDRSSYIGTMLQSATVYKDKKLQYVDPGVGPYLKLSKERRSTESIYVDALSKKHGWRQTRYYHEFLRPFDLGHINVVNFSTWSPLESEMLCMGFHRPHASRPFDSADVQLLNDIKPLLQSIFGNITYRRKQDLCGSVIEALDGVNGHVGCVVLDGHLNTRYINAQARQRWKALMSEGASPLDRQLKLPAEFVNELRMLRKRPGERKSFKITMPDQSTLLVEACASDAPGASVRYVLLSIDDGVGCRIEMACRKGALTLRESELVFLLARGASNADISEELRISLRTVQNHLRAIYFKMAVNSRTQLISRVLGL